MNSIALWTRRNKYQNLSDHELLDLYQKDRNQEILAVLYNRYSELCFGTCMKYLKSIEESKDAILDIYEQLISKVPKQKIDSFKPWLYVVVKNHCLEKLRKATQDLTKYSEAVSMYSEQVFHPDSVDKEKELSRLENCMKKLNTDQRQTIHAFYFEKQSYQIIAKMMKLEKTRVRSHIQNGRRNLKICMEKSKEIN